MLYTRNEMKNEQKKIEIEEFIRCDYMVSLVWCWLCYYYCTIYGNRVCTYNKSKSCMMHEDLI